MTAIVMVMLTAAKMVVKTADLTDVLKETTTDLSMDRPTVVPMAATTV